LGPILATDGIHVSVICPGFITTPMTARNDFPMPFLMPADKAARHIQGRLARGRARIAFPWPMSAAAWLLSALPLALGNRILAGSPGKASF
jgi:NAD(P)-dependent dehydrogenase (short-subunit alcohol dehydrogenase family)